MAIIENFPQEMLDEHHAWHSNPGQPEAGGRLITPDDDGSGHEFLVWHRGYIQRFKEWAEENKDEIPGYPESIEAWTKVPAELKSSILGWNQEYKEDEESFTEMWRYLRLDDLGKTIEWGIHGFMHSATAKLHNEPILRTFHSPKSTYFWQLHGLIDLWRQRWENTEQIFHKDLSLEWLKKQWSRLRFRGGGINPPLRIPKIIIPFHPDRGDETLPVTNIFGKGGPLPVTNLVPGDGTLPVTNRILEDGTLPVTNRIPGDGTLPVILTNGKTGPLPVTITLDEFKQILNSRAN